MAENIGNGKNFVSWRWVVGVLLLIVFAASGIIIGDTRAGVSNNQKKIEQLQEKKVDLERYQTDIKEIKDDLKTLISIQMRKDK